MAKGGVSKAVEALEKTDGFTSPTEPIITQIRLAREAQVLGRRGDTAEGGNTATV